MRTAFKLFLLPLLLVGVMTGCRVEQTQEGELPDVDVAVEEGQLPKYDVDGPDIDVSKDQAEVTVPDVDIDIKGEKKTVPVPDVDVKMPGDPDYEDDDGADGYDS